MKYKRTGFSLPITILVCLFALGVGSDVRAQSPNQVGLVIQFGDGTTLTRCVAFTEPEISGYDVLARSGLGIVAATSSGITICKIEDEGCPAENCFCKCQGATCTYWSYWHLSGDTWQYSNLGASDYQVRHGQVEGWHWGTESPPPVISFDQICAPAATNTPPPPTATPTLPPPSVSFSVIPDTIVAGECAQLGWTVKNVQAVYLDGIGVGGEASKQVCPSQTQVYELRVVGAQGESRYTVTLNVVQPTATATPIPTATSTATPTLAQSTQAVPSTATPSATATPLPSQTPTASPTSSLTPTLTRQATATATPTRTSEPTPGPLLAQVPTLSLDRPAPTPTVTAATRPTLQKEYIVFLVCMVLIVVALIITVRRK